MCILFMYNNFLTRKLMSHRHSLSILYLIYFFLAVSVYNVGQKNLISFNKAIKKCPKFFCFLKFTSALKKFHFLLRSSPKMNWNSCRCFSFVKPFWSSPNIHRDRSISNCSDYHKSCLNLPTHFYRGFKDGDFCFSIWEIETKRECRE